MIHPEMLREAIRDVRAHAQTGIACADGRRGPPNGNEIWSAILAVCRAAESTLPKTKMVETWHVEYAFKGTTPWAPMVSLEDSKADADKTAAEFAADPEYYSCIRVTGPYQQEVPAA